MQYKYKMDCGIIRDTVATKSLETRVTETVQFYVIITYTFVLELGKIMM